MVERMADMPAGVIGLRASGTLTRDDYREVLEPAPQEAIDSGAARVLFVIASYEGLEGRALLEDLETGVRVELRDRKLWKRLGVVTNQEWIAKAMHLFAWATPGDLRVYDLDELDEATGWAAAD